MSKPPSKPAVATQRINLAEDHEVRFWTKEFGVTRDELAALIAQFGDSAAAIRRALDKPHLPKAHRFRPRHRPT